MTKPVYKLGSFEKANPRLGEFAVQRIDCWRDGRVDHYGKIVVYEKSCTVLAKKLIKLLNQP